MIAAQEKKPQTERKFVGQELQEVSGRALAYIDEMIEKGFNFYRLRTIRGGADVEITVFMVEGA